MKLPSPLRSARLVAQIGILLAAVIEGVRLARGWSLAGRERVLPVRRAGDRLVVRDQPPLQLRRRGVEPGAVPRAARAHPRRPQGILLVGLPRGVGERVDVPAPAAARPAASPSSPRRAWTAPALAAAARAGGHPGRHLDDRRAGLPRLRPVLHPGQRSAHGHDVRLWSYAILAGVLALGVVVPMAWCRYLCPLGVTLWPFSAVGRLRLRRDESRCTACAACTRACPHGIDVARRQRCARASARSASSAPRSAPRRGRSNCASRARGHEDPPAGSCPSSSRSPPSSASAEPGSSRRRATAATSPPSRPAAPRRSVSWCAGSGAWTPPGGWASSWRPSRGSCATWPMPRATRRRSRTTAP